MTRYGCLKNNGKVEDEINETFDKKIFWKRHSIEIKFIGADI